MNTRTKLFWLIWGLFVIGLMIWFVRQAGAEQLSRKTRTIRVIPHALHSPKGIEQAVPVVLEGKISDPPPALPTVMPGAGPKWYFAATAVNEEGLESDYSEEVSYRLTTGPQAGVTLSWDRGDLPSANETYKVYRGKQSRAYTDTFKAGTNLTLTIAPRVSKTNRVITVTTQNATNLAYASKLGVRWTFIGATNWTATNPASMRFWRAVGTKNSSPKVEIGVRYQ